MSMMVVSQKFAGKKGDDRRDSTGANLARS
jgi:hypothetical protein